MVRHFTKVLNYYIPTRPDHTQKQNQYFSGVHMTHVTTSMLRGTNQSRARLWNKDSAFKPILYLQRQPLMPETVLRLPRSARYHFLRLSGAITEHYASPTKEYPFHMIRFGNHQGRQRPSRRWLEPSLKAFHVLFKGKSRRLVVFDCLHSFLGDHRGGK